MVARNARPEVIRAAYKTLSQKFHPDLNPDNPDAAKIMQMINASYAVLSDPDKRKQHDAWIEAQEQRVRTAAESTQGQHDQSPRREKPHSASAPPPQPTSKGIGFGLLRHVLRNWVFYGLTATVAWIVITDEKKPSPPSKPYQATPPQGVQGQAEHAKPVSAKPTYTRPLVAPNGSPWPNVAGYIKGYQRLHTDGLSTVTVDNSRNDSDVFVKLVSLDSTKAFPVRHFYIPAFGSFTVERIRQGSYDIRYRDLGTGGLSRSEPFTLEEIPTYNGVEYSNMTMTLYKVRNGNMQTYGISEDQF